jgi:thiol:disulfide interchange protein
MTSKKKNQAKSSPSSLLPKILVLAGVVLLVAVLLIVKNQTAEPIIPVDESPEVQLDRLVTEGKPVFVFFHSNTCQSCIDMMGIVDTVHPEFEGEVALVDVNVYDQANENLLRRANIYSIPTELFIDASGEGSVLIGVITPDQLRQQLQTLAESGQ